MNSTIKTISNQVKSVTDTEKKETRKKSTFKNFHSKSFEYNKIALHSIRETQQTESRSQQTKQW